MSPQPQTREAMSARTPERLRHVVRAILATTFVALPVLVLLLLQGQAPVLLQGQAPDPHSTDFGLGIVALSQLAALVLLTSWVRSALATSRRDQQALGESETRFHSAFDFATIGMALVSPDGRWMQVNRALCGIVGYSERELLGLTFQQITHPDDLSSDLGRVRRLLAGEIETYQMEKRYLHKQGHSVWVLLSVSLVRDRDGKPAHFISQIQDITQRKQAELALAQNEERFQLVVRGSDDGIWDWNIETDHCYFSPRYMELLGYAEDEFAPQRASFVERLHPDDVEPNAVWLRAHFAARIPYDVEYRLRTKSGAYRWFHARGQATWNADGKPIRFTGSLRDITPRQEAEERFRRTADLLRETERMARIGGWEFDAVSMTPLWSEEVYRIFGLDPAGTPDFARIIELYAPEERAVLERAMRAALEEGTPWDLELPLISDRGEQLWVRALAHAEMAERQVTRLFGAFQDITERKNAELSVERSRRFLDAVIESIPQPVWVKDAQHRWVLFNGRYCEMMEREREQLLGKSDPDIYPPERVSRYWAEDDEAFRLDRPLFVETRIVRSDGSVRWMLKSKRAVDLPDGAYVVGVATDITHQKETENALRESEERFRSLTQLSADWFWEQDEQYRFITQTGGGRASMAITPKHMLGKTPWELPFVGMSEADWARHKAMLASHESFHDLPMCRRNDAGELRYVSLSGEPVFDAAGAFKGYRGLGRDITAAKEVEEALRKSEESHRLLADNSSDMISRLTPRGDLQYASPAAAVVLGFDPDQLVGHPVAEFIHPDDAEKAIRLFSEVVKENKVSVVTCRLRHRDEGWVWVETSFRAVRETGSNRTSQVIGVSRNVNERVHVTEALNRFQYVLDHTLDMIFIADARTLRFSYVNLGAAATLGYPREALIGMTPWEVRANSTEAEYRKTIEPLLFGELHSRQFEAFSRRADGTELPVDVTLQIVRRPGEDSLLVWLIRDATERKKIDRMKNEFVSTVSHELRTPLTSILGSLGLIIGGAVGELTEQAGNLVRIAYNNSERLVRLINDILDIEKIESGKMRFELQPQPIRPLLELALEANRHYGEQLGVRFELLGEIPDCVVSADSDRFMQVMSNLLSNAAKFSPSPGTVEIRTTRAEGALRIEVIDHGPGIPENFRDKIFGKFCQADSSDTRQKGGTGLGLNIAKAIMEKHGGQIGFRTQLGAGTTFHVTFPETVAELAVERELPVAASSRRLDPANPAATRMSRRAARH